VALAGRGGAAGLGVKFYFIYAYKSLYLVGVKACSPGPQLVLVLMEAGREMACELCNHPKASMYSQQLPTGDSSIRCWRSSGPMFL